MRREVDKVRMRLDQLRSWRKPRGLNTLRDAMDHELREVARAGGLDGVLDAIKTAVPGPEFEIVGINKQKRLIIKAPDASAMFQLDGVLRAGLERQLLSLSKGGFTRVVVKP